MKPGFWIRLLLVVFLVVSAVLFPVELLKGHESDAALRFALIWGAMTAGVFTLVGYIRFRRTPACMLQRTAKDSLRDCVVRRACRDGRPSTAIPGPDRDFVPCPAGVRE